MEGRWWEGKRPRARENPQRDEVPEEARHRVAVVVVGVGLGGEVGEEGRHAAFVCGVWEGGEVVVGGLAGGDGVVVWGCGAEAEALGGVGLGGGR